MRSLRESIHFIAEERARSGLAAEVLAGLRRAIIKHQTIRFDYTARRVPPGLREINTPPSVRNISNGHKGFGIGLMQVTKAYQSRLGAVELYFGTPELAALHAAPAGSGVEATPIMPMPYGSIFTVHTPDGAPLTMIGAALRGTRRSYR